MRTPFDETWFANLLSAVAAPPRAPAGEGLRGAPAPPGAAAVERNRDWGEAPDGRGFVDRDQELATLRSWVLQEGGRVAAVLGMGGIGKTALAARLAQDLAPTFQRLFWRSLRDALPTGTWLGLLASCPTNR